jgi:hypothetical protein
MNSLFISLSVAKAVMLHHLHEVLILNNRNQQLHVEGLLALLALLLHLFQRFKERLASDTQPS